MAKQTVSLKGIQTVRNEVHIEVDKEDLFNKAFEVREELLQEFAKRHINWYLQKLAGYSYRTSTKYYVKEGHLYEVDGDFDYHHREYNDARIRKLTDDELLELHQIECRFKGAASILSTK